MTTLVVVPVKVCALKVAMVHAAMDAKIRVVQVV